MMPVIHQLRKNPGRLKLYLCFTGQHSELAEDLIKTYNIRPNFRLNVMAPNQTIASCFSLVACQLQRLIRKIRPNLVLVQGDTTSACAAAYAAFSSQIKVGHIEAGLRTHDLSNPFPEEGNRVMIDHLADILFAPSKVARKNLLDEGIDQNRIVISGNTVIDALKVVRPNPLVVSEKIIVVTVHRRESFGKNILRIFKGVKRIAQNNPSIRIVIPAHLNPNVQKGLKIFKGVGNVKILRPLNYPDFINLIFKAELIITDSGGVIEEASYFGKKLIIVREKTERPEVIRDGVGVLTGANTELIVQKTNSLLKSNQKMSKPFREYGSGLAAKIIVKHLKKYLADE